MLALTAPLLVNFHARGVCVILAREVMVRTGLPMDHLTDILQLAAPCCGQAGHHAMPPGLPAGFHHVLDAQHGALAWMLCHQRLRVCKVPLYVHVSLAIRSR